jgi:hypothetical protein
LIADLPLVAVTDAATALAARLSAEVPFPSRAAADALHIAVAAVHGVEFLLTWNCRHIANAVIRLRVEFVCRNAGYHVPVICTPEELTRESRDADG